MNLVVVVVVVLRIIWNALPDSIRYKVTRHFGTRTLRYQDISVPLKWPRSVPTVRVWSRSVSIPELSDSELCRSFQLVLRSTGQPTVMSLTRVSSMPAVWDGNRRFADKPVRWQPVDKSSRLKGLFTDWLLVTMKPQKSRRRCYISQVTVSTTPKLTLLNSLKWQYSFSNSMMWTIMHRTSQNIGRSS